MADDIIGLGGPGRRRNRPERRRRKAQERGGTEPAGPPERGGGPGSAAGEAVESLFRAHHQRLVQAGFDLVGDWGLAEQLALEAWLRLWRQCRLPWRRRWISDPLAAPLYLQIVIVRLARDPSQGWLRRRHAAERRARGAVRGHLPDAAPEQPDAAADQPDAAPGQQQGEQIIQTWRAWHEFEILRSRTSRARRVALLTAAAAAAVAAIAYLAVTGTGSGAGADGRGRAAGQSSHPAAPLAYPGAVVARLPVSGVVSVTGDATRIWVVRVSAHTILGDRYQLVSIDTKTDKVALRLNLGLRPRVVAAGGGMVWATTPFGQERGQVVRIDPGTGRVLERLHLPAGGCTYIGYSAGHLVASCMVNGPLSADFAGISPLTGQVLWQEGTQPRPSLIGAMTVAPQSVWFVVDDVRVEGLVDSGASVRATIANDPAYRGSNTSTQSLVYGDGSVWALGSDESLARISPATGIVTRVYSSRGYDPAGYGGLNFLTVTGGSLWFLDDGYPLSGVLRVSEVTGRPLGRVAMAGNACGQQVCSQIYSTPGAIWVPTLQTLIRIDPARLPG